MGFSWRRPATLAAGLLIFVGAVGSVQAAMDSCIFIEGAAQGVIIGDGNSSRCSQEIIGHEFHHLVGFDPASGLQHHEVIFTKDVDQSTVNLWTAFDNGELLTTVRFRFYRPDPQGGTDQQYFTVTLSQGKIEAIEPYMGDVQDATLSNLSVRERVRISYGQIRLTFEPTGSSTVIEAPAP